ncbi:sugar kinase [Paenibacillus sp. R14(2021)]|uniref:sugar kinase n=1 Tax=Paenibacillus sp. R14(2021) TaxID=2859228 RepID=UPI0021585E7E|nr:sugar kinase [Paenibacillus sp. R14(2021)]
MTPTRHLDVVTFGESMGLFFPEGGGGLNQGRTIMQSFGGAESNVAIALARLGCKPGWFGLLGEDPLGHAIHRTIRGEGVDVSQVRFVEEAPTGLMLREQTRGQLSVYYYRRGSAASLLTAADLDPAYIASGNILHITGITPALSPTCAEAVFEAVRIAKAAGVKVSFDPNMRFKLWTSEQARPVFLALAEQADYFLPGYDELKLMYGSDQEDELLEHVRALPGTTVIKSIANHNLLLSRDEEIRIPFESVERVVDTVGAGDAFTGGFLAGITKGLSLEDAVRLGGLAGALTVQQEGDWEALPFWKEVDQLLAGSGSIER